MLTYPDSVRFLYSLGNEIKTIKLGLDRVTTLLAHLGNPERSGRFVHVAGTNGKGSVCAMIESGLRAAGLRTGLFSSPHLVEPTERIQIAGAPVSEESFAAAFGCVHRAAERLVQDGAMDGHPTYFETVTAMAFLLFREAAVDAVALEVGLGGRLDATNVVQPDVCAITPIDFDHEKYLGNSLEAIAGEKAGILKKGVPAVLSRQRPEADVVVASRAAALGVPVTRTEDWRLEDLELHAHGSRFRTASPLEMSIDCPLAGEHQVENALTAIAALVGMGLAKQAIEEGIRHARWPGRLERVSASPEIVLDGAHNPAGARALAAHIRRFYGNRRVWIVYGAMRDKSLEEVAGILSPVANKLILTAPDSPRALRPEALRELFDHPDLRIAPKLPQALSLLETARPDDAVFITGSLFLVGEARALLLT